MRRLLSCLLIPVCLLGPCRPHTPQLCCPNIVDAEQRTAVQAEKGLAGREERGSHYGHGDQACHPFQSSQGCHPCQYSCPNPHHSVAAAAGAHVATDGAPMDVTRGSQLLTCSAQPRNESNSPAPTDTVFECYRRVHNGASAITLVPQCNSWYPKMPPSRARPLSQMQPCTNTCRMVHTHTHTRHTHSQLDLRQKVDQVLLSRWPVCARDPVSSEARGPFQKGRVPSWRTADRGPARRRK
jgi:hypothetical protein